MLMMRLAYLGGAFLLVAAVICPPVLPQTTQGLILGRVVDSVTGVPVSSAAVSCKREENNLVLHAHVGASGDYSIPSLSPGRYIITVTASKYQTQQARALDIP